MAPATICGENRSNFSFSWIIKASAMVFRAVFLIHATIGICEATDLGKSQCSMFLITPEMEILTIQVKYGME